MVSVIVAVIVFLLFTVVRATMQTLNQTGGLLDAIDTTKYRRRTGRSRIVNNNVDQ
jgi:hypothetical protein